MAKKSKKKTEVLVEVESEELESTLMNEEDLENSGLRELVDKGKEQGFLTYEEINSMLPEDISDPDQVEETIQMLIDIGIEVQERPGGPDDQEGAAETVPDTRTTLTTAESEIGRTTDPVRLYMREMGTVDLLTREGEIAIAKRIEEGYRELLSACCFYPGIVDKILDDYQQVVKEEKRLSEVLVGFMDITEDIPPPAIVQAAQREKNNDEEETSGPDLVEVKKRFTALKKQFNKSEKICLRSRTTKKALDEQEKLGEIFKFFKLSPTQFENIANPARDALQIIRECEREVYRLCVKVGRMPRKEFIQSYSGNESNPEWGMKASRTRKPWAKSIKENLDEVTRLANKLIKLEKIIGLEISYIKDINRKMSIGEAKIRRAKKDMVEANLRLVISLSLIHI